MKTATAIKQFRKSLGMTQAEFWARVAISQSGGSRYESGRNIPLIVRICLDIAYGSRQKREAAIRRLRGRLISMPAPRELGSDDQ